MKAKWICVIIVVIKGDIWLLTVLIRRVIMRNFKRLLALMLACLFVATALVACTKDKPNEDAPKDTENNEQPVDKKETNEYGEESFTSVVPQQELDFGGQELTILVRDLVANSREWYKESPEDELDEAVAMRNAAVQQTLNVIMQYEMVPNASFDTFAANFNGMIQDDVDSDMHYYDIAANYAYAGSYPSVRNYAANLNDEKTFPYFDFSLPCWNQAMVKNTTINGRLHYIAGDINLSMFDLAMVIWYNKTLYDAKREDGDPENIQVHALAGQWTYQDLYIWASRLYENSNGVEGKQADDTYGFGTERNNGNVGRPNPNDVVPYSWDLDLVMTNNDGTHSFSIVGNEKAEEALVKFRNLVTADGTCGDSNVGNFAAGNYVFWSSILYPNAEANMAIREMEDKYGLLPWPKYEASQENYGTTTQDYYNLITVLDHKESSIPTKGEAISAYLQLATEESYTSVRGYYFNRVVKPKYFGTDDSEGTVTNSIALFDIIVANIEYDYWTIYSPQLNDVAWLWRDSVQGGTLEGNFKAEEDAYIKAIEETDAWLGLRSVE